MSEKRGKKRPKSYYVKSANQKHHKGHVLEPGMRGFLVTCNNNHERQAVNESYNILNEYADILDTPDLSEQDEVQSEGTESDKTNATSLNVDASCDDAKHSGVDNDNVDDDDDDDDMEAALKREVTKLKNADSSLTSAPKRFQNVMTKAKNCIFISTTVTNPIELVYNIFSDLAQNGVQKTRYALRLLPIIATCKAFPDDISKCAEPVLEPLFKEKCTFCVVYKCRNNTSLGREEIIGRINSIVKCVNSENRIEYNIPDFVVLVEVIGKVCCIGAARDFFALRKYNLIEVIKGVKELEPKKPKGNTTESCDVNIEKVTEDALEEVSDVKDEKNLENMSQACNLIEKVEKCLEQTKENEPESCDVNAEKVSEGAQREISDGKDETNSKNLSQASNLIEKVEKCLEQTVG